MPPNALKQWFRRWGTLLIYGVVFVFIVRSLVNGWDQIRDFPWQITPLLLTGAFGLYVLQLVSLAGLWTWSVRQLDVALTYDAGIQMWLMAFLSRYIPGGVWSYAYVTSQGRILNLPVSLVTGSYILQSLAQIWAGALTIIPLLLILFPNHPAQPDILATLILFLVTLLLPILLYPVLSWLLRLVKMDIEGFLVSLVTPPLLLPVLLGFTVTQGFFVGILTLAIPGLTAINAPTAFYTALAYAVAAVAGLIVLFMPQGIGVREGAFAWLVAPVMSTSIAITISLGLRMLLIVYDLLILLGVLGLRAIGLFRIQDEP